jgi:thiosulfate/3-mercaptopyruvate sulfurtransferase
MLRSGTGLLCAGILLAAGTTPFFAVATSRATSPPPSPAAASVVVSVEWLLAHRHEADLVLVDARDREAYARGHLPGAISLPAAELDPGGELGPALGRRGLLPRQRPVCYADATTLDAAARLFWLLELAGADRVRLLDGGLEAWTRSGQSLVTQAASPPPMAWDAAVDSSVLATAAQIRTRLDQPGQVILDARGAGYGSPVAPVDAAEGPWGAGHLPGALPVDFHAWLGSGGTLPPTAALRDDLSELDPRFRSRRAPATDCVIYDDGVSGAGALGYLLLRSAGQASVRYYAGGWADWSAQPDLPVVRILTATELRDRLRAENPDLTAGTQPQGFILLDVRHPTAFAREHLPGAVNLFSSQLADSLAGVLQGHWPAVDPARVPVVVYCWGPDCIRSRTAAVELARRGFLHVEWFLGGLPAWHELGEPVQGSALPSQQPLPPPNKPPGR